MAKKMISLTFSDELIQEPVIYRIGHEFKVVTSIFQAAVTEQEGWVLLELEGEEKEIERAVSFLRTMHVNVEERN
ncbi:MAG: FeS-binding protein [Deltaproteobacteria bacterium]|nr:FeS-binding protein [Deltaproteobacteria bacterium]